MIKKIITVDLNKANDNMLGLLSELESKGYAKGGYLVYEESDKGIISELFMKYGYTFLE